LALTQVSNIYDSAASDFHRSVAVGGIQLHRSFSAVLIDAMWSIFNGPAFYTWLKLVVASRSDPALNDAVRSASLRFGEGFCVGLRALLDWPTDREDKPRDLVGIVVGQLEALALERALFATGEIDPREFVRGLEPAKRPEPRWYASWIHRIQSRSGR